MTNYGIFYAQLAQSM